MKTLHSRTTLHFLTLASLLISLIAGVVLVAPAHAAGITVTNLEDSGAGSLRQAIINAIAGGGAEITFNVSGTITLASQLPNITAAGGPLTINGIGKTVTISGNHAVRIFYVGAGASLTLSTLTIANGLTGSNGGGIYNIGTLNITGSTFSGNSAVAMSSARLYPLLNIHGV